MKHLSAGRLSPKANKVLLVINVVLFFSAVVLGILNLDAKKYISAASMLCVMLVTGINIYGCWMRLKGKSL